MQNILATLSSGISSHLKGMKEGEKLIVKHKLVNQFRMDPLFYRVTFLSLFGPKS